MAVQHEATSTMTRLVHALAEHGGWLPTSDLAARVDGQRDTVRRILAQLAEDGWVQRAAAPDGGDRWCLGGELPRLGLAWQARLIAQARDLFQTHAALIPADLRAALERP